MMITPSSNTTPLHYKASSVLVMLLYALLDPTKSHKDIRMYAQTLFDEGFLTEPEFDCFLQILMNI